jgi:hypothetical protein
LGRRKGKIPTYERYKRIIKTILDQIPVYIEKYSPNDQLLLSEFINVIHHFNEADFDRKKLSKRFEQFIHKYRNVDIYLKLPFLWFAVDYLENSQLLLSVARFHGKDFYEYFVQPLRGYPNTSGVFQLLRKKEKLKNLTWEQLQYACHKLTKPLTHLQLQVLDSTYSYVTDMGIHSLKTVNLKNAIKNKVKTSKEFSRSLTNFFTRIDARWYLRFFYSAFGIDQFFFHFKFNNTTSLSKIIDFKDPKNTTLSNSDVYSVRGSPNTYIGIIHVPTHLSDKFHNYLKSCEYKGLVNVNEFDNITNSQKSTSLASYRVGRDWVELSKPAWNRLKENLRTTQPHIARVKKPNFYLSPSFNERWNYLQYHEPIHLINLFCKSGVFTFNQLSLDPIKSLTKDERTLLKELYQQRLVEISFNAMRLIQEYSLDTYWVRIPKKPIEQLFRLLEKLPFSQIFFTESNIYMWTYLTPKMAHRISTGLEWTVIPVIPSNIPKKPDISWFNKETLDWNTPHVIKKEKF